MKPGDTFDRYEIDAVIGQGASGTVYAARDPRLGRPVALKVLTRGDANEEQVARFVREARAAAALDHPCIVHVLDVGAVDGVPFLAMELVAGRPLRAYVGDASVPIGRRVRWLLDVAGALAAAHARGIVHRDVKPENVVITDADRVKVLDFGTARRSEAAAVPPDTDALGRLTAEGLVVGTPKYMAPEQMRGEAFDGRADQFAWGVMAYELLTGAVPWRAREGVSVVSEVLTRQPAPLRTRAPEVPPVVEAAVMRALAKKPDERFATMEDVIATIEGDTVPPRVLSPAPPSVVRRGARWMAGFALAAAALATLATSYVVARARRHAADGRSAAASVAGDGAVTAVAARVDESEPGLSSNPQAVAHYHAGLQSFRDGALEASWKSFETATQIDPTFAAAHLRFVMAHAPDRRASGVLEHLEEATKEQASLAPHDRALLHAFAPALASPPDLDETERRLSTLLEQAPEDADYVYARCGARFYLGRPGSALGDCARAARLDPGLGPALWLEGLSYAYLGDVGRMRSTVKRCIEQFPYATVCLDALINIDLNEGRCGDAIENSRRYIQLDTAACIPYLYLANALAGMGERDSAQVAMQQFFAHYPSGAFRARWEANRAAFDGDFATALALVVEPPAGSAALTPDERARRFHLRAALLLESGRAHEAAAVADAFLRADATLPPVPSDDARQLASNVLYEAGAIGTEELSRRRARWLASQAGRPVGPQFGSGPGYLWTIAYAEPARTPADGRSAIAALPHYLPITDPYTRSPDSDEPIGRAHLLAGDPKSAIPYLKRAATACMPLLHPVYQLRATEELGEALEAIGDRVGACAAYATTLARWGDARPRSRTAERAREKRAALACGE